MKHGQAAARRQGHPRRHRLQGPNGVHRQRACHRGAAAATMTTESKGSTAGPQGYHQPPSDLDRCGQLLKSSSCMGKNCFEKKVKYMKHERKRLRLSAAHGSRASGRPRKDHPCRPSSSRSGKRWRVSESAATGSRELYPCSPQIHQVRFDLVLPLS